MKVHAINLQQIAPEVVGNYLTQAGDIKSTERTYISKPTLLAPNADPSDWVEITPEQKEAYEAEAQQIFDEQQMYTNSDVKSEQ